MNRIRKSSIAVFLTLFALQGGAKTVKHSLHVVSTGDIHGAWFDESYDGARKRTSLIAVSNMVSNLRASVGEGNVLLLDAGDALQGDQCAYYYNYVDTLTPHLFPRMAAYMKYDALVVGNHDIETAHPVYDRIARDLKACGIPYLAGNALKPDGEPYFDEYKVFNRAGLKVLVLGYTNPNIKSWLAGEKWTGMTFESLIPLVGERIAAIQKKEKPQVTILVIHSGSGSGDGSVLESQGLDLAGSLDCVDLIISSHDHAPLAKDWGNRSMMNSGSNCRNVGHAVIDVETSGKKVVKKSVLSEVRKIESRYADRKMREAFSKDFEAVKAFTLRPVGKLASDIRIRDAYAGPSFIMNLIHTVQLSVPEAKLSFSAPLTFDSTIRAGQLLYRDMFTIYKFENELNVVNLTGREIKDYLEYSYDQWIVNSPDHVLKICERPDPRTGASRWSFRERSYNFDSCAGLIYTVDVTKPRGSRILIESLADGSPLEMDALYPVAMTSYRANGGGGILPKGAGVGAGMLKERLVASYPAIRDLIYEYVMKTGTLSPGTVSDPKVIGNWKFIPEDRVAPLMESDFGLLFRK